MKCSKEDGKRNDTGRFSRRHETPEEHNAARARWDADKSAMAKRRRAEELAAERAQRTDDQQIDHLDQRLGKGVGAVRERARLLMKKEVVR